MAKSQAPGNNLSLLFSTEQHSTTSPAALLSLTPWPWHFFCTSQS